MTDAWARRLERERPLILAFTQQASATPGSELAATVTAHNRAYIRVFVRVVEELRATDRISSATPPSLLRDIVFGTLARAARGQVANGESVDVHQVGRQVIDLAKAFAGSKNRDDSAPLYPSADLIVAYQLC